MLCFLKGMKREFKHKNLRFEALQNEGGYLKFDQIRPREISRSVDFFLKICLLCAFMLLSEGEKMRYWDVRNGVGKFRICIFYWGRSISKEGTLPGRKMNHFNSSDLYTLSYHSTTTFESKVKWVNLIQITIKLNKV